MIISIIIIGLLLFIGYVIYIWYPIQKLEKEYQKSIKDNKELFEKINKKKEEKNPYEGKINSIDDVRTAFDDIMQQMKDNNSQKEKGET